MMTGSSRIWREVNELTVPKRMDIHREVGKNGNDYDVAVMPAHFGGNSISH